MSNALLTTAEAAALLGCSTRTIARLAASGELPHVRKLAGVRGGYLFDQGTVELFGRQRSVGRRRVA
jgi:excisionase family DNA binding protein